MPVAPVLVARSRHWRCAVPGLSFTGRPGLVFPRALWLSGSAYESLYLPAILRLVLERRAILFESMNLHIQIYELSAAAAWHPGVPGIRAYPATTWS